MLISTIVGARLGHCFFYDPVYYLTHPLEILYVWKGGLASHGAGIGILIGLFMYSKRRKGITYLWTLDRVAIAVPISAALVRIGNFINSEIIGRPSDIAWSVVFTNVDFIPRHPSQIYEALAYTTIFVVLIVMYKKYKSNTPKGLLSGLLLTMLFTARFFIEFFKETQSDFENTLPIDMGQILSIPMVIAGILLMIYGKKIKL